MEKYFLFLVPIIFTACGNNTKLGSVVPHNIEKPSVAITQQKSTVTNKPKKKINPIPSWIYNSKKQNNICSVGSSTIQSNIANTQKIAKIQAKASISEQIKVYINSLSILKKSCTDEKCSSSYSTTSQQQSTNMLHNIKYINSYTDNKNNIYYVRACIQTN